MNSKTRALSVTFSAGFLIERRYKIRPKMGQTAELTVEMKVVRLNCPKDHNFSLG